MYRYVTAFSTHLNQYKASNNTHNAYVHDVQQYVTYLMQHGVQEISDMQQEHVDAFIAYLESLAITPATAQRKCASLRSFFTFCARLDLTVHCTSTFLPIWCSETTVHTIYHNLMSHSTDAHKQRDAWMIYITNAYHIPFTSLARARVSQVNVHKNDKIYAYIDQVAIDITSYYHDVRPCLTPRDEHGKRVVFPYIRHGDPIIMPRNVWVQRIRSYVLSYTRSSQTRFNNGVCDEADAVHKKQYSQFHERA